MANFKAVKYSEFKKGKNRMRLLSRGNGCHLHDNCFTCTQDRCHFSDKSMVSMRAKLVDIRDIIINTELF